MGCPGLLEKSWRVQCEEMVRELVIGEVDQVYASTMRGRPDRWNAELWSKVYGFKQGGEGMATKKEDCTRDKLSKKLNPKYGYFVKKLQGRERKKDISFLGTHFEPGEALQHHSHPSHHLAFCILREEDGGLGKYHWGVGAPVGIQHQARTTFLHWSFPLPPLRARKPAHGRG